MCPEQYLHESVVSGFIPRSFKVGREVGKLSQNEGLIMGKITYSRVTFKVLVGKFLTEIKTWTET